MANQGDAQQAPPQQPPQPAGAAVMDAAAIQALVQQAVQAACWDVMMVVWLAPGQRQLRTSIYQLRRFQCSNDVAQ